MKTLFSKNGRHRQRGDGQKSLQNKKPSYSYMFTSELKMIQFLLFGDEWNFRQREREGWMMDG